MTRGTDGLSWLPELFLRSQSDERLASLARGGHDRAFATIVERYRSELLAFARRLNSDGRAEDVLQQALLNALVALRSGTEVNHVRGWLYQIVRHTATKVRAPRDIPLDDIVVAADPLEDVVATRARALGAVTELARLPQRQRDALLAVAVDGRSGADVAATMGMSEGAVRQLVYRARATLRGAITAVTPWPVARWLAATASAPAPDVAAAAGVVSVGGITAKAGALVAAGLVATTVAVLPTPHHRARAEARHQVTRVSHPAPERVLSVLASSGGTTTAAVTRSVQPIVRELTRVSTTSTSGPLHRVSRRDSRSPAGSRTHGRSGNAPSPPSDSRRDGDGAIPSTGDVTSSHSNGSDSSGSSTQTAETTTQTGHAGNDGDAASTEASSDATNLASDTSASGSGSGRDGGGSPESASSGPGHSDSTSGSDSSDPPSTPDH